MAQKGVNGVSESQKAPVGQRDSVLIPAPSASAFGDDEEDYHRTLTRTKRSSAKESDREVAELEITATNFGKATFSKSPKGFEEVQTALTEEERRKSSNQDSGKNGEVDQDSISDQSTDQSMERSDDQGHISSADSSDSSDSASWARFAQTRFQMKVSHSYCCAVLQQPLLPKKERADHLASLAAWATILRIMGDLPEVDYGETFAVAGQTPPVVSRVRAGFMKKYTKKDVEDAHKKYSELFKDPSAAEIKGVPFLPDNRESMLEKVQYVCSLGIFRADIRDELYCQVCKQLTNNPSRNSTVRGWVLLMMFAASFSPSEKFSTCFLQFLQDGPTEYAQRVEHLLRRTFVVGTRGQPPSWLEFQAAKNGKPILIPVILMNGNRYLVETDSATTVNELCTLVSHKLDMKDRSGFSIYISLQQRGRHRKQTTGSKDVASGKIACLGHGLQRIMDAVAECEQFTKDSGMRESSSTWRLYFRKEFFTPWYDPNKDPPSTELTYQQIMRGVSVGEYKCEKDEVLIMMAAQRYYIEHSVNIDNARLEKFVTEWFPKDKQEEHGASHWVSKVKETLTSDFKEQKPDVTSLKADIVTFAMNKWYTLFSRFYDVGKIQGPNITWTNSIIGVNCKGIYVIDDAENIKIHFSFVEITNITRGRHTVTLTTIQGDQYVTTSIHSEDLFVLVMSFQTGLRRRSRYAIAVQDASHFESAIGFGLSKGDLVKLDKEFEDFIDSDVYSGTCTRSGKHGSLPRDVLYVLPTSEEPNASMLGMLAVQLRKDTPTLLLTTPDEVQEHTLQAFAKMAFRHSSDSKVTKFLSKASLKKEKEPAWKYTKEMLKKPLLRRTNYRDDLKKAAIRSFLAIQQYMGEAPNKEHLSDIDIVSEHVIDPAMRNRHLREEIFCQIMKQLTQNPDKTSEDRGWQLLWLLSSSTYPLTNLFDELELFLKHSKHPFSKQCLERLQRTKEDGCRAYPPHIVEHEALTKKQTKITFIIMMPDQSQQKVEVDSSTKLFDISKQIVHKFGLKHSDEYGLFFGLKDKVINVVEGDYFFDFLTHVQRFWGKVKTVEDGSQIALTSLPVLVFMRKLWMNAVPGQDKTADVKFHFPQEIPNYLRGYHKCSPDDALTLASLLFRAKYGDEKQPLQHVTDILPTLLPKSILELRAPEDWKKLLEPKLSKLYFPTQDDAKVAFLKELHKWPTYGSVFFEVKQRSTKTFPKQLLVAVNMNGVFLVDSHSKDVLVTYSFEKIPNWAFDDRSFTLVTAGDGGSISKLYFETNVGHNLDDIIMSYVSWIMNSQIKKKPVYAGIVVGESFC